MVNTMFEQKTILGIKFRIALSNTFVWYFSSFRATPGNTLNLTIYIKNPWASLLEMLGCIHLIFYAFHALLPAQFMLLGEQKSNP